MQTIEQLKDEAYDRLEMSWYRRAKAEAEDYYDLTARARRLGIDTTVDESNETDPVATSVAHLRERVEAAEEANGVRSRLMSVQPYGIVRSAA